MNWFRKNKDGNKQIERRVATDRLAQKIAAAAIRIQNKISTRMNSFFSKMTLKNIKILLFIFCIGSGGYSMYLVTAAMVGPMKKKASFRMEHQMEQFSIPKHIDQSGEERISPDEQAEEQMINQLQRIKSCMDSLKLHNKKIYDSIRQARPGLMDSVQMLEEIYHKKKLK